ncbi:oligosaccharide flippase family protein [candidate division KSB1 bacterium]|nr:oligosaccharide flippase family protein [candidate division KSB1 bacterium]
MNWIKKLAQHTSKYFLGEVLILSASLISFPIFARILSKADYGIMNIVSMTIDLVVLSSELGLRASLYRFYSQYEKQSPQLASRLFASIFWTTIFISLMGVVVLNLIRFLPESRWLNAEVTHLLGLAALLVLFRTASELIFGLLRIREQSTFFIIGHVGQRYAGMLLSIYFLVYLNLRLVGLYRGLVLGEGLVFLILLVYIIYQFHGALFQFSKSMLRECTRYGLPLVGQNWSHFINSVGDRYVIQYFKGFEAVGIYSIGYNLANYVQGLFINTIEAALIPMTMNIWNKQGTAATQKFLTQYFSIYSLIFFPVIFGMTAVAHEAVVIIGSEKFAASAGIVGYIIIGVMTVGAFFPASAGLYFQKKTTSIAKSTFYAASLNMILNIFWVPIWGIKGAAIATLVSCVFQVGYSYWKASKFIKIQHNFRFYGLCFLCAGLMFITIKILPTGSENLILNLILKIIAGTSIYVSLILTFDRTMRNYFKQGLKQVSQKIFLPGENIS